MTLTDRTIKAAKPKEKPYKLSDSKGLYLEISPAGGKLWRLKYRFDGREKRLSFGAYPEVSLADAREQRDEARSLLVKDIDPGLVKRARKQARAEANANNFEAIAREWHTQKQAEWSEGNAKKLLGMLENDVFPLVGKKPVADLRAPDILEAIRKIEKRGALEAAHTTLQTCGRIIRYAIATG